MAKDEKKSLPIPTTAYYRTLSLLQYPAMSSHDGNQLTDPRILVITAVFFLYGVFVILVLFFAGAPFWNGLWQLCKDFVGCGDRASAGNDVVGGEGDASAHRDG